MAENKITPLPWGVTDRGKPVPLDGARLQCVIWSGADVVAYCHPRDVHLLATAPDLLAAAAVALSEMCRTVAPSNSFTDAVDALDAAITKAKGKT